ncbi:ribonuclease III [Cardinium endosymbiont of Culicoides punctatus]|uniref:ribonuclease III n=1 Tax=Cardinium endosymbiont of Culicoides punctatus TaxID=2304601 RepID=UPI0010590663|nr:ribonuclease III [Cardinium endosymbiont of Culicoides punctatus]TDG94968.1 Ribonuclease 3 [Cardinium endosymbiont of Culicoides punctatus]
MGRILNIIKFFFIKKDAATQQLLTFVRTVTGRIPSNISLYKIALQHSFTKDKEDPPSNERLEFLGDAVLSLAVADFLFKKYPLKEEGFLTEIRSRLVNRSALNELARKIHLDKVLHYRSNVVKRAGSRNIYGNALEALIGAIYLDHGYEHCKKIITERLIGNYISLKDLVENDQNFKSKIIKWAHKNHVQIFFNLLSEKEYNRYREFTIQIRMENKVIAEGTGRTKKNAEQMAAQQALQQIEEKWGKFVD